MEEAQLTKETTLSMDEKEKAKCVATVEEAETSRKIVHKYTIEEIEEATNLFSNSLKVGEGGYGPIYICELDHTPVAVKILKPDAAQGQTQFQQEVWKTQDFELLQRLPLSEGQQKSSFMAAEILNC
ncbi:U-box domain-containing protein [Vigna angularis]|uniref:RING-type E3 ubiquitin transferase n=1 Tax=Phaseolus angularis TaxID=3914 RepID=A0A8T0KMT6_PHAAN|nr:U-box domain-containing protein [Vigna angularis]